MKKRILPYYERNYWISLLLNSQNWVIPSVIIFLIFSLKLLLPSKTYATEYTIDSQITTTTASQSNKPLLVFTDTSTGYIFYKDSNNVIVYSKTTDGGINWDSATAVTSQADIVSFSIWYDGWTPSDSGTKVHLVYMDSGSDDIWYDSFDTNGDTNANEVAINTNAGNTIGTTDSSTITKGTSGDLYVAFCDGSSASACNVITCNGTCESASNWGQSGSGSPLEVANNYTRLFPLINNDVLLVRDDVSAEAIQSKVFNYDTNSWDSSWYTIDSAATDSTTYRETLVGTIDKITGDVYIAYGASVAGANTADIRTAVFSTGSWQNTSDVVTDVNTMVALDIAYDQTGGKIYVGYIQGSATTNRNIYYKKSLDGMDSWTPPTQVNSTTGDLRYIYMNLNSTNTIYISYYQNTTSSDVLFGATLDLPAVPPLPYANNNTAQQGKSTPALGLTDTTPSFSAVYDDLYSQETATYYQVQVGTDSDWTSAEMWDSTQVALGSPCTLNWRCEDIVYNGSALSSSVNYYWRIRFWDNSGNPGNWSEDQIFALAGETQIDNAITTTTNDQKSNPLLVFTNAVTGYMIYKDSTNRITYSKTTNGGLSWSTNNDLTAQTDVAVFNVWYDGWTPGNTGSLIHVVYIDTGSDDVWYDTIDTSDDSLGTEVAIDTSSGNQMSNADNATISRGTNGDLYTGFCNGSTAAACKVIKCSSGCNSAGNWSQAGTSSPLDVANDFIRLFPLSSGNMILVRDDISAERIQSKVYSLGSNAWDTSWTDIDTSASDSTTYRETLTGTVNTNNNDIYIAYGASVAVANSADIRTATYNGSTWTNNSDVVTNVNTMINLDIAYDQKNGDTYVAYVQGTAGSNTSVFYKMSTDNMSNWGGATQINSITGDIRNVYLNQNSSKIIYAAYYRNTSTTDDLYGYPIATLVSPPNSPQTPYANNSTAQSGASSPVYKLTDLTPAFSAIFDDNDTADTANYYEIEVGTNTDWFLAETWKSSKTSMSSCNENNRCNDIIYSGPTLNNGKTYYWRILYWDDSGQQGFWSDTQLFSINGYPTVTNVTVNTGVDIVLQENTTATVNWTATITDPDGYSDIASTTGKLYRSSVAGAETCTENNQNCYSSATCSLSGCSGTTCTATCSASVYFFADPTDTESPYPTEYWLGWIESTDYQSFVSEDFSPDDVTDLSSLTALDTTASISFGSLFAGENSASTNQPTTLTNTGNITIDAETSGSNMCKDYPTCSGTQIPVGNIEYSTSNFTYNSGTDLTGTPAPVQLNLTKSTLSPSTSTKDMYWGIALPATLETGNYSGENSIVAAPDT